MTLLKACTECGEPSDRAKCREHRPKDRKPSARTRGYDAAWDQLSKRARRLQPFCTDCGTTDDLTVDHSEQAWTRKEAGLPIRLEDVDVVCRSCNARRGAARPGRVDPPQGGQDPRGKAEFQSLTGSDTNADVATGTDGRPGPRVDEKSTGVDVYLPERGGLSTVKEHGRVVDDPDRLLGGHARSLS